MEGVLVEDDCNGVIENRLAEDDVVDAEVGFDLLENGEDGDGVGGGDEGAVGEGLKEVQLEGPVINADKVDEVAEDGCGDDGTDEGEGEDATDVEPKFFLLQVIAGFENDGRQEQEEEELVVENEELLEDKLPVAVVNDCTDDEAFMNEKSETMVMSGVLEKWEMRTRSLDAKELDK